MNVFYTPDFCVITTHRSSSKNLSYYIYFRISNWKENPKEIEKKKKSKRETGFDIIPALHLWDLRIVEREESARGDTNTNCKGNGGFNISFLFFTIFLLFDFWVRISMFVRSAEFHSDNTILFSFPSNFPNFNSIPSHFLNLFVYCLSFVF